jgi:hypothetical protein
MARIAQNKAPVEICFGEAQRNASRADVNSSRTSCPGFFSGYGS